MRIRSAYYGMRLVWWGACMRASSRLSMWALSYHDSLICYGAYRAAHACIHAVSLPLTTNHAPVRACTRDIIEELTSEEVDQWLNARMARCIESKEVKTLPYGPV